MRDIPTVTTTTFDMSDSFVARQNSKRGILQGQHAKMARCMIYWEFLSFYCVSLSENKINAKLYALESRNRRLMERFFWYILSKVEVIRLSSLLPHLVQRLQSAEKFQ